MPANRQVNVTVLRDLIEREAAAANLATSALGDYLVAKALRGAAALVRERRRVILAASATDLEAAAGRLDEGTLDRLRLDDTRIEGLARQAEVRPRSSRSNDEAISWTLPNGLRVSERRIPIGTVGANFEARPNVALDVAERLRGHLDVCLRRVFTTCVYDELERVKLSMQTNQGGDVPLAIAGTGYGVIGILVIVLLAVLILYFVRRA
jgi:uncharacterized protein (DUF1778 family)